MSEASPTPKNDQSPSPKPSKNVPASGSTIDLTPRKPDASSDAPSPKAEPTAHFVLQGKGGVGKTFVASLLAQYLGSQGKPVTCIDTDPVNASLREIKGLKVETIDLFKPGSDEVDFRSLDGMINRLAENPGTYVIDNGASSFKPVSTYLFEQGIIDTLHEAGIAVTFHLVIATGPEIGQTLSGARSVIEAMPPGSPAAIVVWLNEHRGPIEGFTDGASLEETSFYLDNAGKVSGVVTIPHQTRASAENVSTMLSRHLTFDEAMKDSAFYLVEKSRLRLFRSSIFDAMGMARIG